MLLFVIDQIKKGDKHSILIALQHKHVDVPGFNQQIYIWLRPVTYQRGAQIQSRKPIFFTDGIFIN